MGRKIRADLVGTTHVHHADGSVSVLAAGDEVPDGVSVGDHLISSSTAAETVVPKVEPAEVLAAGDEVPKPRGNAGRDAWAKFAVAQGVEFGEDATRDDIKAAVEAAEG